MKNVNLNELSDTELAAELKRRKEARTQDREVLKSMLDAHVPKVVGNLFEVSQTLSNCKADTFKSFVDILKLKSMVYDVKSEQQSHTFSTDNHTITIGYRILDAWDDSAQSGVAKVNQFIKSLAKDENSAMLVQALTMMLKPDKKGNLKASRILEMQKLANEHPFEELVEGVNIISEAHRPVRSNWFIEASIKDADGKWNPVPLSISACEWPEGFDFNFLAQNS